MTPINNVSQPTISGQTFINLTTSASTYAISGQCDANSAAIQYSLDASNWNEFQTGCAGGTWTTTVTVTTTLRFYVRARTRSGFTGYSTANIAFVAPAGSPNYAFVSGGVAMEGIKGQQTTLSSSVTGTPMTSANNKLYVHMAGIEYGN